MTEQADMNALDTPDILSVVFHPRREFGRPVDGSFVSLEIPVADGVTLGGRFYEAGEAKPTVLFFHGNGEIVADYGDIAPMYASLGINFLPVDYRGYGRSTGSPTISSMLADARTVFEYARECLAEGGHTGPLVIMGRSLGSAPALEIASAFPDELDGLIIESGFADTAALIRRLGARVPEGVNADDAVGQTTKIARYRGPLLIIHGAVDFIIPAADARALLAASGSERKRLLIVEGAGHNDLLFRGTEDYMRAVAELVAATGAG
jgi:fermentation-respiration switch protein FrsA (DUF1100 family)